MTIGENIKLVIKGLQALPQILKEVQDIRVQLEAYLVNLDRIKNQMDSLLSKFPFR